MIQGSCGPAWNSTSRPPAPHASMLMNARTLRAHLRRIQHCHCLAVRRVPRDAHKSPRRNCDVCSEEPATASRTIDAYLCCVMKAWLACMMFSSAPLSSATTSWRRGARAAASARSVSSTTAQPAPSSLAPAPHATTGSTQRHLHPPRVSEIDFFGFGRL